jgi:hypothetical protein
MSLVKQSGQSAALSTESSALQPFASFTQGRTILLMISIPQPTVLLKY